MANCEVGSQSAKTGKSLALRTPGIGPEDRWNPLNSGQNARLASDRAVARTNGSAMQRMQ
jgi:hypothetical protein